MKLLILYTELAGYTLACLDYLLRHHDIDVRLIRWPINQEAPFDFRFGPGLEVFERNKLTQAELDRHVQAFAPDGIFCSGWIDKGYVKALKHKPSHTPVICGLDNQWTGTFRQKVASWLSPWLIKRHFDYIWGAGPRQRAYAQKLGYDEEHIREGYYSADVDRFSLPEPLSNRHSHPTLLYVGRIMAHKGIQDLVEAFLSIHEESQWRLQLVGKPDGSVSLPSHPRIDQRDFVQPDKLPELMAQASAFVLPSHHEPWGVALHEAAAAGLPLIASDACGSGDAFVQHGQNGLVFPARDVEALSSTLGDLFSQEQSTLTQWGKKSHELAKKFTPQTWAETLMGMIRQGK